MHDDVLKIAVDLRHELHEHPELSNHESWTKERLKMALAEHTHLEVTDRGKWFYAKYAGRPGSRKIAFRADFDALPMDEWIDLPYGSKIPGVAHKCGHDGHSAGLVAFGIEVERAAPDATIYLIFQHAEETGDGAKECAVLIDEEGIDEVYGYHNRSGHPLNQIIVRDGCYQCASTGMSMFFKGVPSHASDPGIGRNPAVCVSRLALALPTLTRPEDHEALVLATIVNIQVGEPAFGMSASDGVLRVTLRAEIERELDELIHQLDSMAYRMSAEYGLGYHYELCDTFPENRNHDESVERVREAARMLGLEILEQERPRRGSEDFGWFTKRTKGAYFSIGTGESRTNFHTPEYDFNDEIIPTGVEMFKILAGII